MRARRPIGTRALCRRFFVLLFLVLLVPVHLGAGSQSASARQTTWQVPSTKTVNLQLVFDASGSMAEGLGDETKIEAAKRVLNDVIDAIPERPGINVGFRVFGHEGDNTDAGRVESCRSTELLVPMNGVDKALLRQRLAAYQPTGWTPIALSLEQAGQDFDPGGESISNVVVLVTDGEETCGGDPCAAARSLHDSDVQLTTYVIGFGTSAEQQSALECIAEEGGGRLLGANSAEELSAALFTVLQEVEIVPATGFLEIESIGGLFPKATITGKTRATDSDPTGTSVTIVLTRSNRVELEVGTYDVRWVNPSGEQTRIRANIEADRTTWIRGSILEFPQGAGETYSVVDQSGIVIWQAPFELGDRVWVLPGIYRIEMVERVGNPILISAELQTLPGAVTKLEVLTAP